MGSLAHNISHHKPEHIASLSLLRFIILQYTFLKSIHNRITQYWKYWKTRGEENHVTQMSIIISPVAVAACSIALSSIIYYTILRGSHLDPQVT